MINFPNVIVINTKHYRNKVFVDSKEVRGNEKTVKNEEWRGEGEEYLRVESEE